MVYMVVYIFASAKVGTESGRLFGQVTSTKEKEKMSQVKDRADQISFSSLSHLTHLKYSEIPFL